MDPGTDVDIVIVGAGIIGLSTALSLSERHTDLRIAILEKEAGVASHQSGHNSGVIHSGIYYAPGSLKAKLCRQGVDRMFTFCDERGIEYDRCGKLIVATHDDELDRLETLYERGTANGVPGLRRVGADELSELEPNARGVAALLSPGTGVVDFKKVAQAISEEAVNRNVEIHRGAAVRKLRDLRDAVEVETTTKRYRTRFLVNCAGLHSDRIARKMGIKTGVRIIPFRGQYYEVAQTARTLLRHLVYPVPDPRFPFLGVHVSKTIDGHLKAGPNAVLALGREGYTRRGANARDAWDTVSFKGFWALAQEHRRYAIAEYKRSLSRKLFLQDVQRLVPGVRLEDLAKAGAGVRAQAVARDGSIIDDFFIEATDNSIHVVNAPSPGATASLAIGDHLASLTMAALEGRPSGTSSSNPPAI